MSNKKDLLTDNFKANLLLTPVAVCIYFFLLVILDKYFRVPLNLKTMIIFISIYIYSSRFYQPDLDHKSNRPGKAHFPLGKKLSVFLMKYKTSYFSYVFICLSQTQMLLARLWYITWTPFTFFVTHRGATHIPIFGTIIRTLYLCMVFVIIRKILIQTGTDFGVDALNNVIHYLKALALIGAKDSYFALYCMPVYIADIIHQSVDLYDSKRRGYSYCPTPKEEWGLVKRLFPKAPF